MPPDDVTTEKNSDLRSLAAELAEIKKEVQAIRRAQKRATVMGVIKILIYLSIPLIIYFIFKDYLSMGLNAITGLSALNQQPGLSGSTLSIPANFDVNQALKTLRELQSQK